MMMKKSDVAVVVELVCVAELDSTTITLVSIKLRSTMPTSNGLAAVLILVGACFACSITTVSSATFLAGE